MTAGVSLASALQETGLTGNLTETVRTTRDGQAVIGIRGTAASAPPRVLSRCDPRSDGTAKLPDPASVTIEALMEADPQSSAIPGRPVARPRESLAHAGMFVL